MYRQLSGDGLPGQGFAKSKARVLIWQQAVSGEAMLVSGQTRKQASSSLCGREEIKKIAGATTIPLVRTPASPGVLPTQSE